MFDQLNENSDLCSPERPTVVLLTGMDLTEQNWERTGIEFLMEDFEIIILDCRLFLGRVINTEATDDPRFQNTIRIVSAQQLSEVLDTCRPMYAIDFIGPCKEMKDIQTTLKKIECKFVIQKFGSLPRFPLYQRIVFCLRNLRSEDSNSLVVSEAHSSQNLGGTGRHSIYFSLLHKLLKNWTDYRDARYFIKADVSVAAGRRAVNECRKISKSVISVMSADAHKFQTTTSRDTQTDNFGLSEPFVLFIDDALIHASDWTSLGIPPPVREDEYFRNLTKYFAEFESFYKIPIVIAGHPQCKLNTAYIASFSERRVIFGHTPELVLKSCLTIVHSSTATSFAVLAKKPIMVITSESLDKTSYGLQIRALAVELGTSLQFFDQSLERNNLIDFSKLRYKNYLQEFIVEDGCHEIHPWERFKAYNKSQT